MNLDIQYGAGDNRHLDLGGGRRGGRGGRGGRNNREGRKNEGHSGGFGVKKDIQLENQDEFPTLN